MLINNDARTTCSYSLLTVNGYTVYFNWYGIVSCNHWNFLTVHRYDVQRDNQVHQPQVPNVLPVPAFPKICHVLIPWFSVSQIGRTKLEKSKPNLLKSRFLAHFPFFKVLHWIAVSPIIAAMKKSLTDTAKNVFHPPISRRLSEVLGRARNILQKRKSPRLKW